MQMTTQDAEMDALGAEALPSGFAEIQRTLQSAPAVARDAARPERREAERAGGTGRRQHSPADAG